MMKLWRPWRYNNFNVIFAIDRAGIVGEDGPTHQGIFDIAYLRNIPNLITMAPKDGQELAAMLEFAFTLDKPVAIRYPKDKIPNPKSQVPNKFQIPNPKIQFGKAEILREGKDIVILALGSMVIPSIEAAEILKNDGIEVGVINSRFVKPLDVELVKDISARVKFVFTVEEGIKEGGFGSAVTEVLDKPAVIRMGLPDEFVPCGKREILLEKYGLTAKGIASTIKQYYR